MKIYKILNDYLRDEIEDGKIDFVIRARIGDAKLEGNKDAVYFYIHPLNKDGDTQDYRLESGQMFVDMGTDVAEGCPECGGLTRQNSETGNNVLDWTECTVCKWSSIKSDRYHSAAEAARQILKRLPHRDNADELHRTRKALRGLYEAVGPQQLIDEGD